MTDAPPTHDPYSALRFPNFRLFITYKFFVTIGLQIQSVLVGWQIYEITKDPLSLGLIGLAEVVPNVSVALFAGYLADHLNRKHMMLICLTILIAINAVLGFYSADLSVTALYIFIGITGFARGFLGPASFGLQTETVPRELYINSSSWSSSLWQIAAMIGAGSAGFLFSLLGFGRAYKLSAAIIFISFAAIVLIKYQYKKLIKTGEPIVQSIYKGIEFVFKNEVVVGAMSLDLFAVLFGGAVALLPIYANEILHVGAEGLGMLRAAPSFGAFLMALVLTRFPPARNAGKKLLWAVALFGVFTILFAISRNYYFSLFCLFMTGAIDNISVVVRSTIMQTYTPDDMKGRVSSVSSIFISSSNELGAFESGVAAKLMGTVPSVIFGGVMTMLVVAIVGKKLPKLKKLEF